MVDMVDLESTALKRVGSTPTPGTNVGCSSMVRITGCDPVDASSNLVGHPKFTRKIKND